MKLFKTFGEDFNYEDIIQLDGAFYAIHKNYGNSLMFNKTNAKYISNDKRKDNLSSKEKIKNINSLYSVNGTEQNLKKQNRILLWENYWLEYINTFDSLINIQPKSIVTIFVGRQAIEIGFKFLLLKKTGQIIKGHDLGILSNLVFKEYNIKDDYMDNISDFCDSFCRYIEGDNSEYFRFPEYKKNTFFAGNHLDAKWILYNFSLIILKLIHFADFETKFE